MHDPEFGLGLLVVAAGLWLAMAVLRQPNGWFRGYVYRITTALIIGRILVESLRAGWGFEPHGRTHAALWLVIFCLPLVHALFIEAQLTYQAMMVAHYAKLLAFVQPHTYSGRSTSVVRPVVALNR